MPLKWWGVVEIEWSNSTFLINKRRDPRETFVGKYEIAFKKESITAIKSTESTITNGMIIKPKTYKTQRK